MTGRGLLNAKQESRLGGGLLAMSMAALIVIVPLYLIVYGQPAGTGPSGSITPNDWARHLLSNWNFVSIKWQIEVASIVVLIIGSAMLAGCQLAYARAAWTCVAVGALSAMPMYFVMLGGYPVAAETIELNSSLYPALRGIATATFTFSYGVIHLGMAGVFWLERTEEHISAWLAILGVVLSAIASVLLFLSFIGYSYFQLAGPPSLGSYIVGLVLGISLCRAKKRTLG